MVAEAVADHVVAAAFCYPADSWLRPISTPIRRLIRRIGGQARWDDRLPALWRHAVVAITKSSLLVFEYRVGTELGPCLGRWPREEISIETKRTQLKRSYVNGQTDVNETARLRVLRLTATTPDGPLALDLPTAASPGEIRDFEQAVRSQGHQSDRPLGVSAPRDD
jgi:hypothetical protein